MSDQSHIEWCNATWNVIYGCTRVSAGCDHCYIERTPPMRMTHRKFDGDGPGSTTGVMLHPERLDLPLRWRKPKRIFVNSMSDLFHDDVPDEFIARVFAVMDCAPQHTFQVLTKRHARMRSLLDSHNFVLLVDRALYFDHGRREAREALRHWPLPNVWLGVSVENQQWADIRIPALLETPAAVRFLSCEPLLGPLNLQPYFWSGDENGPLPGVDWCIVGGESGPGARPMDPRWVRSLRDQCVAAGVPFLFKQWGEWVTEDQSPEDIVLPATSWKHLGEDEPSVYKVGKKAAGRELDGRTWDEYPATQGGAA